jgi:hypothetical protein
MSFSDWITIVSILLAVLLVVFKYDEWEIIKLKKIKKHVWLPITMLIISGITSFFHTNQHPNWLNFFWSEDGISSAYWPLIWMIIFFITLIINWIKFVNDKPKTELINLYNDYLSRYEPSRFSSIFRKYEKGFFSTKDEQGWLPYQPLLVNEKWWSIASCYFKKIVFLNPNRFYNMKKEVLESLLFSQISEIPNSQITRELEIQNNGLYLGIETPILNIFLSKSNFIEFGRNKNILIPTIKRVAENYFSSVHFNETDITSYHLAPSNNSDKIIAPNSLKVFFLIQFVDCYWQQVINTNAKVSGFYLFEEWCIKILNAAPQINKNNCCESIPNLFISAIDRMHSKISGWISIIKNENHLELKWAAEHFCHLNLILLKVIQNSSIKIPDEWIILKFRIFYENIIDCRNLFTESFNPEIKFVDLENNQLIKAFDELTNLKYYLPSEKKDNGYQWLKGMLFEE